MVGNLSIKFGDEADCIMLISGHNLRPPDGMEIKRLVKEILQERKVDFFYGNLFGRFDLVVEFSIQSPKIATYLAGKIQKEVVKKLPKSKKICSTMVLANPISRVSHGTLERNYNEPIRAYVLLRMRKDYLKELDEIVKKVKNTFSPKSEIRLMWTSSLFHLLIVSSPCFDRFLEKLRMFRSMAKGFYEETASYIALKYGSQDGKDLENSKHQHILKTALVFVKLEMEGKLELVEGDFSEISPSYGPLARRLGGYDRFLLMRKRNLHEIINVVNRLRDVNDDLIFHTSTLLVYPEGDS